MHPVQVKVVVPVFQKTNGTTFLHITVTKEEQKKGGSFMVYPQTKQHKWGTAKIIENNSLYCGKLLRFTPGHRTSLQYHKNKDETLYVLSGHVTVEYGKEGDVTVETMNPDDVIRFTPGLIHRISSETGAVLIEVSTHHEDSDTYQLKSGGKIPE